MTLNSLIWIVGFVVVFGGALWYIFRNDKNLDVNKDGKVDLKDTSAAIEKAVVEVEKAVEEAVAEVKKRATKTVAAKKVATAKKPRAPRKKKDG